MPKHAANNTANAVREMYTNVSTIKYREHSQQIAKARSSAMLIYALTS